MENSLTKNQKIVFNVIQNYINKNGHSPLLSELKTLLQKRGLKISSLNSITQYLKALEEKGYIKRNHRKKRGIKILKKLQKKSKKRVKKIKCYNCFYRWRFQGKSYCDLIEDEYGGSVIANRLDCENYIKKGTEPRYLCAFCGKNTFGKSAIGEKGKWYCKDCYKKMKMEKEAEEIKQIRQRITKEITEEIMKIIEKYIY